MPRESFMFNDNYPFVDRVRTLSNIPFFSSPTEAVASAIKGPRGIGLLRVLRHRTDLSLSCLDEPPKRENWWNVDDGNELIAFDRQPTKLHVVWNPVHGLTTKHSKIVHKSAEVTVEKLYEIFILSCFAQRML